MNNYYLGIDPSLNSTGIALLVVSNNEIIRNTTRCQPDKTLSTFERTCLIRDYAHVYIKETLKNIDPLLTADDCKGACIEGASYNSVGKHDELGQLRGALKLWLHDDFVDAVQVAPTRLKKFATGYGGANKEDMVKAATTQGWILNAKDDDQADAAHLVTIAYMLKTPSAVRTRKQLEVLNDLGMVLEG